MSVEVLLMWHSETQSRYRFLDGREIGRKSDLLCNYGTYGTGSYRTGNVVVPYRYIACSWSREKNSESGTTTLASVYVTTYPRTLICRSTGTEPTKTESPGEVPWQSWNASLASPCSTYVPVRYPIGVRT